MSRTLMSRVLGKSHTVRHEHQPDRNPCTAFPFFERVLPISRFMSDNVQVTIDSQILSVVARTRGGHQLQSRFLDEESSVHLRWCSTMRVNAHRRDGELRRQAGDGERDRPFPLGGDKSMHAPDIWHGLPDDEPQGFEALRANFVMNPWTRSSNSPLSSSPTGNAPSWPWSC